MNTYKALLQYKGTSYLGWQIQPVGKTIQGELNKALLKISKFGEIKTLGSGRTDAGVHALGQVVKITFPFDIGAPELRRGLNSLLPDDIQIIELEKTLESFHPIGDASWKEYVYLFSTSKDLSLFYKDFVAMVPFDLDLEKIKKAAELFVGTHDFLDFQCVGTPVNSTVRKIIECEVMNYDNSWGIFPATAECMLFRVRGEGFLKQMVRLMMGTLWNIGRSRASLEELGESLQSPLGKRLGAVAPSQGLYLKEVFYKSK